MDTQVSPLTRLTTLANDYFSDHVGVSFDALAAPIGTALPCGGSLRGTKVYQAIERARRHDDPSLPMGIWEHDAKRADWDKVTAVAADALCHKSKDLQLAAWLLEAQIHKHGFAGIAPCLLLMRELCERYWEGVHPAAADGDLDFRGNVFRWINEKLLPALRLAPITAGGRERDYCWADWEQAQRNERLREQLGGQGEAPGDPLEGATVPQLTAAMTGTSTDLHCSMFEALSDALAAIDLLAAELDRRFGHDGPGFAKFAELLGRIASAVEDELHKRGVRMPAVAIDEAEAAWPDEDANRPARPTVAPTQPGMEAAGPIRDRADAYARLAEAAAYLASIEPHSPVPYFVNRAVAWGHMNTADLYQELFIRLGGQLNIFEMLGLEAQAAVETS